MEGTGAFHSSRAFFRESNRLEDVEGVREVAQYLLIANILKQLMRKMPIKVVGKCGADSKRLDPLELSVGQWDLLKIRTLEERNEMARY